MKSKVIFLPIVLVLFCFACKKHKTEVDQNAVTCTQLNNYDSNTTGIDDTLCTSDTCVKYQAIWLQLFLEKNIVTEEFFNNHIILKSSYIESWNEGVSFYINYQVQLDWAVVNVIDQFIIKINKDSELYPALNLPTDTLLTKDDISVAINNNAFSSSIQKVSGDESLQYSSYQLAMDNLVKASGVEKLCYTSIGLNASGHISITAYAEYINKDNSCIPGTIDLLSGQTTFTESACRLTAN